MILSRNTILIIVSIQLISTFSIAKDIEHYLAEFNRNGFPSSILYEAIEVNENANKVDETMLIKYLESRKTQMKAIKIALQYAADKIKGNVRSKMDNATESRMCDYSWVAWLPWSGCPQNVEPESINKIELVKDQNYKCYKTKF